MGKLRLAERLHRLLCLMGVHLYFVNKQKISGDLLYWDGSWRCGCCGKRKEK